MSGARGRPVRAAVAVVVAVVVAAAPGPPARGEPAGEPAGESVGELLSRMRDLYRRAEASTEAYRTVQERTAARRARVDRLQNRLADTRVRLDAARDEAGRLARQQYRSAGGAIPAPLRLLLGRDEGEVRAVLEHGRTLDRMAARRTAAAARLSAEERRLDELATRARGALDRQLTLTARHGRQREEAGRRLAEVQRLLASLTDAELDALRRAEAAQRSRAARGPRPRQDGGR